MFRCIACFALVALASAIAISDIAHANSIGDIQAGLEREAHADHAAAAALYTRALNAGDLSPLNQATAYLDRCNAYDLMGNFDRAIADCSKAIQFSPTDADTYADRCAAFNRSGDYSHGIADCTAALRLDPKNAAAYNNRCNAYFENGDSAHAIADCEMAVRFGTGSRAAAIKIAATDRCLIEARLGQSERGDPACVGQDDSSSVSMVPYANRGEAYFEAGQFAAAADDFSRVRSRYIRPLSREIWLFFAWDRSDRIGSANFVLSRAELSRETWNSVLLRFLRGGISATQLVARANDLSGADQQRASCDALFVIGEQGLAQQKIVAARQNLQEVSDNCARVRPDEHAIAAAELTRLRTVSH